MFGIQNDMCGDFLPYKLNDKFPGKMTKNTGSFAIVISERKRAETALDNAGVRISMNRC